MTDHSDYTAMSELMWAGSLSHNGLTGLGGQGDWSVHQLGHEISARFDLAHGASLAAVWGSWARLCVGQRPARFAQFARNVWGIQMDEERAAAEAGINATVDFFASLGMPTGFDSCIGLQTDETCADMAYRCAYEGTRTIGTLRVLGQADIEQIYLGPIIECANHAAVRSDCGVVCLQTVNINFMVYCLVSAPVCAILCSIKERRNDIWIRSVRIWTI